MQIPEIGAKLVRLQSCDSTNAELSRTYEHPDTINGTVVLTYQQTAGRGQRGNTWLSEANKDLTFSFLLNKPDIRAEHAFLPVAATALAVCEFLGKLLPQKRIEIKWPNDILCEGKKISGMLIEHTFSGNGIARSIIGIGVNLNSTTFGPTRFPATSALLESDTETGIDEALFLLLPFLNASFNELGTYPTALLNHYNSKLYGKKQYVPVNLCGQITELKLKQVDMGGIPHFENKNGQAISARPDEVQFMAPTNL